MKNEMFTMAEAINYAVRSAGLEAGHYPDVTLTFKEHRDLRQFMGLDRMRTYKRFRCDFDANVLRSVCVRRAFAVGWQEIRKRIFERDGHVCTYCGGGNGLDLECDHIVPVARGGGDDDANLTTACAPCNRSKGAKTLEEWGFVS